MQQSGVWLGALWWAAGPWWGTVSNSSLYEYTVELIIPQYFQSIEPPSGAAVPQILPQALVPFL